MKLIESQHWQMSLQLLEKMRCHVVNADSSSYTANLNSSDTKTCYANLNLNNFFVFFVALFICQVLNFVALLEHLRTKNLGQSFCSSSQSRLRRRKIWKAKMRPSVPVEKQIFGQEIGGEVFHYDKFQFLNLFIGKVHFVFVFLLCFGLE